MVRISMTLAFDSQGEVYYALGTHNTNSATFSLFINYLAGVLDQDRPGWRKNTVLLVDNASYHGSVETMLVLEALEVPIMFSGPYSFNIAACELFFARLKEGMLNPNDLPLGKR